MTVQKGLFGGVIAVVVGVLGTAFAADMGTAVTYQGFLENPPGTPFTGTRDFEFSLWDAAGMGTPPMGGTQIGATQTVPGVGVSAGIFTVRVPHIEFGGNAFNGTARWLEIHVKDPADALFIKYAATEIGCGIGSGVRRTLWVRAG